MKRKFALLLLGAMVIQLLAGCAAPATTPAPEPTQAPSVTEPTAVPEPQPVLKIGVSVSQTGATANLGSNLKDGYAFWMDRVNELGGIQVGDKKYLVELVYYDDASDAETSVKLTEKLITDDEVSFLFGPFGSGTTNATSAVGEKYEVLTFASMANANSIYERGFKYTFGILPLAGTQARPGLELAKAKGLKTVAIVTPDDLWPRTVAEGAKKLAEDMGLEVVYFQAYPKGANDLSSMISQMKALAPDALVGTGYEAECILMTRQMKELKFNADVVVFSGATTYFDFIKSVGVDSNGILGLDWWTKEASWSGGIFGDAATYAKDFQAEFGYEPRYVSAAASAAGEILRLALEAAGTTETEAVKQALLNLDAEIFFGKFNFDETGANTAGSAMGTQIVWSDAANYKFFLVWPLAVQLQEPLFPKPFWGDLK